MPKTIALIHTYINKISIMILFVCLFETDVTAKSRWALSKEAMPIANTDR